MIRAVSPNQGACEPICVAEPVECDNVGPLLDVTLTFPNFPGSDIEIFGMASGAPGLWGWSPTFESAECGLFYCHLYIACYDNENGAYFIAALDVSGAVPGAASWGNPMILPGLRPLHIDTALQLSPGYTLCPDFFVPGPVQMRVTERSQA